MISEEALKELDRIRDRRDCSYSDAIMWLVTRKEELLNDQRKNTGTIGGA
jgi:predicted CopG family antitoxin